MNSIQLIGRITAPPELRHTPKGVPVAETTLCVDDGFGDAKVSYFFRIVFWEKKAEAAAQYLVKGQKIGITGKLTQEEFTPKGADKPETKTRIRVFDFDFLEKPAGAETARPAERSRPAPLAALPSVEDEDDDIPF